MSEQEMRDEIRALRAVLKMILAEEPCDDDEQPLSHTDMFWEDRIELHVPAVKLRIARSQIPENIRSTAGSRQIDPPTA